MPIIDLVELLDDLWFGSPMWFLPYVDDGQAEAFGGDGFPEPQTVGDAVVVGRLPRGLRASNSGTSEAGTSVVQRAPSGLTGWFQNKFGDKRRLSQSEKPEGLVSLSDPCSTLSPPHSRDEDESRDVEPIVGTWGHRQTNYSLAASLPDDAEENGEPQGSEEGGNGSGAGKTERATSAELDRKMSERAWEWRFRQRWAKEHMQDPDATGDQNEEDGLAFMQKHGAHGWQQQFEIRDERSSRRKAPGIESASSQEMFFGPLQTPDATPDMRAGLLQHENSLDVSGEATKKIEHLAQQAKELIMKQQQIDEQVTQRCSAPPCAHVRVCACDYVCQCASEVRCGSLLCCVRAVKLSGGRLASMARPGPGRSCLGMRLTCGARCPIFW